MDTMLRETLREHRRDYAMRELIGALFYFGGFAATLAVFRFLDELAEKKERAGERDK